MSYTLSRSGLLDKLLGDPEVEILLSDQADIDAMLRFELALAKAQNKVGLISDISLGAIETAIAAVDFSVADLTDGVAKDGLVVPALVRAIRASLPESAKADFHKGTTSQDLIDSSLMMRLVDVIDIFRQRLDCILDQLDLLSTQDGHLDLMARTRMQRALPFTVKDKLDTWAAPLRELRATIPGDFPLQLGGPIGTLGQMGDHADEIAKDLAARLGLRHPARSWHTDRRPLLQFANWSAELSSSLGKIGQDVALMSQNEILDITITGGGSSSAMPHKNNPVLAEVLVALAHYNATLMGGLHNAALHENERSGAAWTLEWMLFPQIVTTTGAALKTVASLLSRVKF
ncbi:MAG: 3-carboxy-cis,cis-muconate cycloisomerase [Sneathiella sp.]|nr:MAG: 3-carboxy-cis,cis-muconate cycloisomerase [Sneathiella sp.]